MNGEGFVPLQGLPCPRIFTFLPPSTTMAKGTGMQKEKKKEPAKSPKEKKAEKLAKKEAKNRSSE